MVAFRSRDIHESRVLFQTDIQVVLIPYPAVALQYLNCKVHWLSSHLMLACCWGYLRV